MHARERDRPAGTHTVRRACAHDLDSLNGVVERAFMTWNLPERVKRLSLPSYRYHAHDLAHMRIVVAEDAHRTIVGVAAWDDAASHDLPAGCSGLLLHGLYVDPGHGRRGTGTQLLNAALDAVRHEGRDGLLVKAQADANGFFAARGMQRLPLTDPARDYPHRFWRAVSGR
ncbi:MAG: GNAT family N-acetyltransferase [Pseudomonadota bacterium]